MSQHLDNVLSAVLRLVPRSRHDTVMGCRAWHVALKAQTLGHRPGAGLHHRLGDIPERLDLDRLAVDGSIS